MGRWSVIKLIQVRFISASLSRRCSVHPPQQQLSSKQNLGRMTLMKDFPVKWIPVVLPLRRQKQKGLKGAKSNKKGTGTGL